MYELGVKIIQITNMSPVFKGAATILAGVIALFFVLYMKKRGEPESIGVKVFTYISIFIILFGLYILIFKPGWWELPY